LSAVSSLVAAAAGFDDNYWLVDGKARAAIAPGLHDGVDGFPSAGRGRRQIFAIPLQSRRAIIEILLRYRGQIQAGRVELFPRRR
jgi:hypothetical protein